MRIYRTLPDRLQVAMVGWRLFVWTPQSTPTMPEAGNGIDG